MKTLKNMALAAFVCCGQQAIAMQTSTSAQSFDTTVAQLGNALDSLITNGANMRDVNIFSAKKLECESIIINLQKSKSVTLKTACQKMDYIGQVLTSHFAAIFGSKSEGKGVLEALKNSWFKDIATYSKLKRNLSKTLVKKTIGTQTKYTYDVYEVEYK